MAGPRPLVVVGTVLAGGLIVSHGLLWQQVDVTNDLLRAIVGAQRGEAVPAYTDGGSTFGSGAAASVEVEAPDGTLLQGQYMADLIGGNLVVTSSDGQRISREVDPEAFRGWNAMSDASVALTQTMLLELHGWPEERWPEGWSP
jgi:hypothetical protein